MSSIDGHATGGASDFSKFPPSAQPSPVKMTNVSRAPPPYHLQGLRVEGAGRTHRLSCQHYDLGTSPALLPRFHHRDSSRSQSWCARAALTTTPLYLIFYPRYRANTPSTTHVPALDPAYPARNSRFPRPHHHLKKTPGPAVPAREPRPGTPRSWRWAETTALVDQGAPLVATSFRFILTIQWRADIVRY